VVEGKHADERRRIGEELQIGRDATGLRLRDALVSRQHARLAADRERVVLEHLGPSNGRFVNGERISSLAVLSPADRTAIGLSVPAARDSGRGAGC
jgi:pSer/pThr/pTyr-binding forkhead associated (FHA) protein